MTKRCKGCSAHIDSGVVCDDCYKPNVISRVGTFASKDKDAIGVTQSAADSLVKDLDKLFKDAKPLPRIFTLPTESSERKNYPVLSGCLKYFPAALAGVAKVSKEGNDKHNPGQVLHHARDKSMDHGDCIVRHLMDVQDLIASNERSALTPIGIQNLLTEVSSLAWRALAYSQELHEQFGAPLAPGAKMSGKKDTV